MQAIAAERRRSASTSAIYGLETLSELNYAFENRHFVCSIGSAQTSATMTGKPRVRTLYDHPSDMEPLLPEEADRLSSSLALALIRGAERLGGSLHPATRKGVADLVRSMNSYYSNLIEGHRTKPADIDAAIRRDFSTDPAQRRESANELPRGSARVLAEIFLRGEIARGDVSRIIGASPRTAQKVTGELLSQRLAASGSPKGPLRLGFPADAAAHYFPDLYPAGAD